MRNSGIDGRRHAIGHWGEEKIKRFSLLALWTRARLCERARGNEVFRVFVLSLALLNLYPVEFAISRDYSTGAGSGSVAYSTPK